MKYSSKENRKTFKYTYKFAIQGNSPNLPLTPFSCCQAQNCETIFISGVERNIEGNLLIYTRKIAYHVGSGWELL